MNFFRPVLFLLLFSTGCGAQTTFTTSYTKVAIVDTGLNLKDPRFAPALCPTGHTDFTGEGIEDKDGHGTHVAGLIRAYAADANYCLIILKFYSNATAPAFSLRAFAKAVELGADFVNFSAVGLGPLSSEESLIRAYPKTTFVTASGNDGKNLDVECNYFPACYDLHNVITVGGLLASGSRLPMSNYGAVVDAYELGDRVISSLPDGVGILSGTSMATAIHTGKLVYATKTR